MFLLFDYDLIIVYYYVIIMYDCVVNVWLVCD